jgi:hypothetical protein
MCRSLVSICTNLLEVMEFWVTHTGTTLGVPQSYSTQRVICDDSGTCGE